MKVARWGNSLAVRLPSKVVQVLNLKEDDEIEITVEDQRTLGVRKKPGVEAVLKRLRKYRGRMPKDFKFDRLEAHARQRDDERD